MKAKKLTIENIGIIEKEVIELDKPMLLFFGEIKQGKTTILNAVKLLFGGSFPADIIRHGEESALVELELDTGLISRSFYVNKNGETVARQIQFTINNKPVKRPAEALKEILNPFLIDQNFLVNKSGIERQKYFVELFDINTEDADRQEKAISDESKNLRAEIKGYGEINIEPVELPDIEKLAKEKAEIDKRNDEKTMEERARVINHNKEQDAITEERRSVLHDIKREEEKKERLELDIKSLKFILNDTGIELNSLNEILSNMPEPAQKIDIPDIKLESTIEIEEKISNAKADKIRYEQYIANMKRKEEKEAKQKLLKGKEAELQKIRKDKIKMLSEKSESIPINDLIFDESGNATYQGCSMDMLSTSQLMELSLALSALYPEGIGLELIDRAESLGESIYTYIAEAKAKEKTILATIVGKSPATTPENIGVFVVEKGKIQEQIEL